jgi:ssDNA-binding Zn-finger/Zn-ribbon topoisomerase 1
MRKKCKGCGRWFDGLPSEDYCDECVSDEENLMPWDYITDEEELGREECQTMSDFVWRGECLRCRHIWFSEEEPKKCPKCGFTHAIMKDKLKREAK